jgi:hypothetical protein
MNQRAVSLIFISILSGLNLGSILKAEDPIRDTQTNPILYEQKKEEEKDGKKGPLLYHVKNNPRESFFIDPPFEKEKGSASRKIAPGEVTSPSGTADWWEEQSTGPRAVSPGEKVSEPVPESLPQAGKKGPGDESVEQPADVSGAENAPSGKGDDYWW